MEMENGNRLPGEQIQSQLVQTDAQLKPMVKGVPQTAAECHTSLMKIVSDYCRLLRQASWSFVTTTAVPVRLETCLLE